MIRLERVTKTFNYKGTRKVVADNVSMTLPTGRSVGLLGRNGAGKSTMLKMIAGLSSPDRGRIIIDGSISWPIGLAGGIHADLTGAQNVRFIARVYGVDSDELVAFVRDFAELGHYFDQPVRTYSSGMRGRISFGLSMGIRFDTYLIDEVSATGDASFKAKSQALFAERMGSSGAVFVSHSPRLLRRSCDCGAVLEGGKLTWFEDIDDAIEYSNYLMLGASGEEVDDD